jgi:hypothetical protein
MQIRKAKKMSTRTFLKTAMIIQVFLMMEISAIAADVNTFLTEDFEGAFVNGAPDGWTKSFKTGTVDWIQGAGDSWIGDTAHGGSFNAILYQYFLGNHETYLISPVIAFPKDTNSAVLEFWHKQPAWARQDTLKVYYRTSSDGLWTLLASYTSDIDNWTKRTIALPNLSSTYYIAFLGNAGYGYGVCIDDVRVYQGSGGVTGPAGDNVTNYYAVVCGISDYQSVSDLSYCDDDARDIKNALLGLGNWKSSNITMLIDSAATKGAIQAAIQDMADKADGDDVCLFYFSGHGRTGEDVDPLDESDNLDEYLVTYDSLVDTFDNDIRDDELGSWIGALRTNKYVVLIDSCFSGGQFKALAEDNTTTAVKGLGYMAPLKGDGFVKDIAAATGAKDLNSVGRGVVITACDDDELSEESSELQNGVFTYYLVAGLTGLADNDGDRRISAEECFAYASPLATDYNPEQHAQISDNYPGELFLTSAYPYVSRCTVTAGSVEGTDSISASGELAAIVSDFNTATNVTIAVDSNDMNIPCVLTFPVDGNTFKNGKFSYSKTINRARKSFKYDTKTHKFTFAANKLDLSGLSCPLRVAVEIGDYNTTMSVKETIVNGPARPIPIKLMMGVKDSLRIDRTTVRRSTRLNSDWFTISGGFAVYNVDVNMVNEPLTVTLGELQTFIILANSFKANRYGFACSKIPLSDGSVAYANFNFKTCVFTVTIKNTHILAAPGTATVFGIESPSFSGNADIVLK